MKAEKHQSLSYLEQACLKCGLQWVVSILTVGILLYLSAVLVKVAAFGRVEMVFLSWFVLVIFDQIRNLIAQTLIWYCLIRRFGQVPVFTAEEERRYFQTNNLQFAMMAGMTELDANEMYQLQYGAAGIASSPDYNPNGPDQEPEDPGPLQIIQKLCIRCVEWKLFDLIVYSILGLYAIFLLTLIAVEDYLSNSQKMAFEDTDTVFLGLFALEIVIRLLAHTATNSIFSYFADLWNLFDFTIVFISWVFALQRYANPEEATSSTTLALLRLLRLLRLVNGLRKLTASANRNTRKTGRNQLDKNSNSISFSSPVERVLEIFREVRAMKVIPNSLKEEITWSMDVVGSNKLYSISVDGNDYNSGQKNNASANNQNLLLEQEISEWVKIVSAEDNQFNSSSFGAIDSELEKFLIGQSKKKEHAENLEQARKRLIEILETEVEIDCSGFLGVGGGGAGSGAGQYYGSGRNNNQYEDADTAAEAENHIWQDMGFLQKEDYILYQKTKIYQKILRILEHDLHNWDSFDVFAFAGVSSGSSDHGGAASGASKPGVAATGPRHNHQQHHQNLITSNRIPFANPHLDCLPLVFCELVIFHELCAHLEMTLDPCFLLMKAISGGHVAENPYHNALHACDVLQGFHCMLLWVLGGMNANNASYGHYGGGGLHGSSSFMSDLRENSFVSKMATNATNVGGGGQGTDKNLMLQNQNSSIDPILSPHEVLAGLFAAAIHDYQHPGVSNAFLVRTKHPIALRYNDSAILENHHVAAAFYLMLENSPEYDIFATLNEKQYAEARKIVIQMVLATDTSAHFAELSSFKTKLASARETFPDPRSAEDKQVLLNILLHAADISNSTRKSELYFTHVSRTMEEYFRQGDIERDKNLPVSMFFDRESTSTPKCQLGFIDVVVLPLFTVLGQFLPEVQQTCLENLWLNRTFVQQQDQQLENAMNGGRNDDLNKKDKKATSKLNKYKKLMLDRVQNFGMQNFKNFPGAAAFFQQNSNQRGNKTGNSDQHAGEKDKEKHGNTKDLNTTSRENLIAFFKQKVLPKIMFQDCLRSSAGRNDVGGEERSSANPVAQPLAGGTSTTTTTTGTATAQNTAAGAAGAQPRSTNGPSATSSSREQQQRGSGERETGGGGEAAVSAAGEVDAVPLKRHQD
ncbi:unnamed protein product [Amoebophrya sp. A120]|nr:unnamed protein product [Amoebophrya sp. A120]|eukprot:GSA120T00004503001.1